MVVLNLHRVSPHGNAYWPPMHPTVFEDLLRFLSDRFEVTTFREIRQNRQRRPLAVLSFDDGYYDFVEYAAPLLAKYGLSANQNVIPECVISGLPPWNIQLSDFLQSAPRNLINRIKLDGFN